MRSPLLVVFAGLFLWLVLSPLSLADPINGFDDVDEEEEENLDSFIRECVTGALEHDPDLKNLPACQKFAADHPKATNVIEETLEKEERIIESGEEEGEGLEGDMLMPGESEPGVGVPDEDVIFQDLEEDEADDIESDPVRFRKRNVAIPLLRWPGGIIKYKYTANISAELRVKVESAIKTWTSKTCLKFELTDSNEFSEGTVTEERKKNHYLLVRAKASGCNAGVGFYPAKTPQYINLGPECSLGNIIHEMAHVIGVKHTQSRQDRDTYVRIHFDRVQAKREHNFEKSDPNNFKTMGPYDYGSIMHYPPKAFAKNGQVTIEKLKPTSEEVVMGQRVAPTDLDFKVMNEMYNCKTATHKPTPKKGVVAERIAAHNRVVATSRPTPKKTTTKRSYAEVVRGGKVAPAPAPKKASYAEVVSRNGNGNGNGKGWGKGKGKGYYSKSTPKKIEKSSDPTGNDKLKSSKNKDKKDKGDNEDSNSEYQTEGEDQVEDQVEEPHKKKHHKKKKKHF